MASTFYYRAEDLKAYMIGFFTQLGVPQVDAEIAADVLIAADLRGVDSHGIIRLHTYYGNRLRSGQINPLTPLQTVKETLTTLLLDGGNGLGQVAGYHAMQRCIAQAEQSGVAMVTVRNSNHYGIAGYYAMMALPHDMIGMSFTNTQPLVAPTYGRKAILGTNAMAVAAPAGQERPFVLDMATSIVPIGRITVYDKARKEIPAGWGIDKDGRVTTQPGEVLQGGALLPLGGIDLMRGYKGYGLALMIDILCGVLSGADTGAAVGHAGEARGANVGHFFIAMKIEAFRPLAEFKQALDELLQQLKESPKAVDQERIYIHGEKEFEAYERNLAQGVPLMDEVVRSLRMAGEQAGIPFDVTPLRVTGD